MSRRIRQKIGLSVIAMFLIWFFISYRNQEKETTHKLNECSFFTIIHPIRMPDYHKLYFSFNYNGKKVESSISLGSEDVGFWYTQKSVLEKRYFIEVYCKDFQENRVVWDIPVPDTLKYIPTNGWEELPYGLGEKK